MGPIDILVIGAIGLMAGWPWLASAAASIAVRKPTATVAPPKANSPTEEWRQTWTSTLIRLIDDIETGEGSFTDEKVALKLSKELLWQIIGGDGPTPSKAK